ncbi:MAG: ribosomal protein S18-alanine N-acetyltransferase [Candidatus Hydrothermarchaeales archaeon]
MIVIRNFRPADLGRIYGIEQKSFKDPYHVVFLMNLYELYPEGFFVAEKNSLVAGYVISRKVGASGHILAIAVAQEHRRGGIGRALMEQVIRHFLSLGIKDIWLEVRVSNEVAIRFYNELGFNIQKRAKAYYSDGEDAVVLERKFAGENLV